MKNLAYMTQVVLQDLLAYWLNDGCYAWIIDTDPYCCEVVWDEACVDLYFTVSKAGRKVYMIYMMYMVYTLIQQTDYCIYKPINSYDILYNYLGQVVIQTSDKIIDLSIFKRCV